MRSPLTSMHDEGTLAQHVARHGHDVRPHRRESIAADTGRAENIDSDIDSGVGKGGDRDNSASADGHAWLVVRAAGRLYALPLDQIIETMRALPIKEFAGVPPFVRGLAVIRGAPVPVIDVARLFGDDDATTHGASRSDGCPQEATHFVAAKTGGRTIALAVGSVVGIRSFDTTEMCAVPPLLRHAAKATAAAVGALDAELLLFLRTVELVSDDTLAALEIGDAA
jgi:purine-binding chemotaxis protein CheW